MLHQGSSPLTLLSAECLSSFVGRKDRSDFGDRISKSEFAAIVLAIVLLGATVTRAENGQIARGIQRPGRRYAGWSTGLCGSATTSSGILQSSLCTAPVVIEEPACRFVQEQFWDG
jgi:hypothetical protein